MSAAVFASSPNVQVLSQAAVSPVTGVNPNHGLAIGADGALYGTTDHGGDTDEGIFFKLDASGNLTQLSSFGGANGSSPSQTGLVRGKDGNFYAIPFYSSPSYPNGALRRITPDGQSSIIGDFAGTGVAGPLSLIASSDGALYGTADNMGGTGITIFTATTAGAITMLAQLSGQRSFGLLVEAADNNLYIMVADSDSSSGKLYRITKSGEVTVLHTFSPSTEGALFSTGIVLGPDGNLYATLLPSQGNGSVLCRITLSGEVTVIQQLHIGINLVAAANGRLYGLESVAGHGYFATNLYRVTLQGEAMLLKVFASFADYLSGVSVGPDGNLYGTSQATGPQGRGAIFRVDASDRLAFIYLFAGGEFPASALIQGPDSKLYGTTMSGGSRHLGEVFRIAPDGSRTPVAEFDGLNGRNPSAALALAPDGKLYGVTTRGGSKDVGVIFSVTTDGQLAVVAEFPDDVGPPTFPLTIGPNGAIYGVTAYGGVNHAGSIFKVADGSLLTLFNFNYDPNAATYGNPVTALTLSPDGKLYGVANTQTPHPDGTVTTNAVIYSISTDGPPQTIYTFDGSVAYYLPAGSYPNAYYLAPPPLVAAPNGDLYGANASGVFRLTTAGQFNLLSSVVASGLMLASDDNLYASVPSYSYTTANGRLVRITPDGITSTVATFNETDGGPLTSVTEGTDHLFYGSTTDANGDKGELYRAGLLAPQITGVTTIGTSKVVIHGSGFSGATRVSFGGVIAATYSVDSDTQITATLGSGSTATAIALTTPTGVTTYPAGSVAPGPVLNISTRLMVGAGDNVLIAGFIVQGSAPKKVLVRGIGPSLRQLGVAGALGDPLLEVHDSKGILATNDSWQDSSQAEAIMASGIAPSDSHEAAILQVLAPGSYTAVVRGAAGLTGVGLVEVYDLDPSSSKLANISTRGVVQSGEDVMIGGFIVGNDAPGKVLVRALGRSLASAQVSGALADPQLELRDSDGNLMAQSDNWPDEVQAQEITDTGIAPSDPKEAAIVASLVPGNYTAVVRGVKDTTGIGLVEVYKLD